LSWLVLLLPYLEEQSLYAEFKLDEPWDSPNNKRLLARMPKVYHCPSWSDQATTDTTYQVLVGPGTMFEKSEGISMSDVPDGIGSTLLVVESTAPVSWTQPSDITYTPKTPVNNIGSKHPGGSNALFTDGSVKFIKSTLNPATLEALATRNGGEAINESAF
jgi:prepilin-type processing-associated H-X9-DG protein